MKISVDAGALCAREDNQFGNYTFSKNIIRAIYLYGKKYHYTLYSFCDKDKNLTLSDNMVYKKIIPTLFWSKFRVGIEEVFKRKDLYLALNQSVPMMTFSKIISFSHGLSFKFYPGLYKNYHTLSEQLDEILKHSDRIIVSSIRVKNEIAEILPQVENKVIVLPFGVPFDMKPPEKKVKKEKYFMHVGQDHPIKNVQFIIRAFKKLRKTKKYREYKLYLAGYTKNIKETNIIAMPYVTRVTLKKMYQKATAILTSSFYESFNLPVLEALSQKTQVVGLREAIVPEFRAYVRMADSMDGFVDLMKKSVNRPLRPSKDLEKVFSWKKYVKALENVYKL